MKVEVFQLKSETDLAEVVRAVRARLTPRFWVSLRGDLGVGKTTFVRAFMRDLGYEDPVVSPSYPLMVDYEVMGKKIIHIDGFRLEATAPAPWDWREWESAWVFVEWAEKTGLPAEQFDLELRFDYGSDQNSRRVELRELKR